MAAAQDRTDSVIARPSLVLPLKVVAGLFAALMLVQAFLAGQGIFEDPDFIDVHRTVGMVVWLVALLQVGLAVAVFGQAGLRSPVTILSAVIFVLVTVQLMLGFASEDNTAAAAWHIPTGVLIFGMATANNTMVFRLGRSSV
jgi:hypothetical protein